MERNKALDICKGIGILLVVIGHMGTPIGRIVYGFHMGLFFFLSGLCFKDSYLNGGLNFIKKRAHRLLLPYLFFPLMAYLFVPHEYSPLYKMWSISYPYHLLGTMWFLKALFIVSILCWIIIKISYHYFEKSIFVLPIIVLFVFFIFLYYTGISSSRNLYYCTFYLMGYSVKKSGIDIFASGQLTSNKLLLLCSSFLVLVFMSYYAETIIQEVDCSTFIPYFISSSCGIYLTCQIVGYIRAESIWGKIMASLGCLTMSIMIFNWASFWLLDTVLDYLDICLLPDKIVYWASQLTIAIAIPVFLNNIYSFVKDLYRCLLSKFLALYGKNNNS